MLYIQMDDIETKKTLLLQAFTTCKINHEQLANMLGRIKILTVEEIILLIKKL